MKLKTPINFIHDLMAMIPRHVWTVLSVMAAVAIVYVGTRPASQLPQLGFRIPYEDKILHFLAYAVLASFVYRTKYPFPVDVDPRGRFPWLPILLVPFLLGSLDEFFQGLVEGRSRDPYDLLADTLAGIVVCTIALRWRALARRRLEAWRRGKKSGVERAVRTLET